VKELDGHHDEFLGRLPLLPQVDRARLGTPADGIEDGGEIEGLAGRGASPPADKRGVDAPTALGDHRVEADTGDERLRIGEACRSPGSVFLHPVGSTRADA